MKKLLLFFCMYLVQTGYIKTAYSQAKDRFAVIAYYSGKNLSQVDSFEVEKLTHIIFSFCHLKGARLNVDHAVDSLMIQKLIGLKKRNPDLKVMLSLGGWGGCSTCSDVFSSKKNRKIFAQSVKELNQYFGTDGIDLDWEYPAIPGYPDHKYQPTDKENFTKLVKQLRKTLGKEKEISFAAGGFTRYINEAIEWKKIMKRLDRVNLMTYDLVHGYSTATGHHTALYSTDQQSESIDNAVQKLIELRVPREKIIIGAAFYGRMWEGVANTNTGLYQKGKFKTGIAFKNMASQFSSDTGFVYHWDETAMAPYLYNARKQLFFTYDDRRSIELKTKYAIEKRLGGIMFWELVEDAYRDGLLDQINRSRVMHLKQ